LSLSTYTDLKTEIASQLRRADTASYVDNWVLLAETEIYRVVRARDMETAFSSTIANGVIALPTGYIDLKFGYVSSAGRAYKLHRRADSWVYENYPVRSAEGLPKYIAREASNFIFGPYPDSTYTVAGVYYKNLGAVSSSAHALFTSNPDLYLYGSLWVACRNLKDDKGAARWEREFRRAVGSVNLLATGEQESGGSLAMSPG
jgi:hypothetical protein